jgi:hypothetical protein
MGDGKNKIEVPQFAIFQNDKTKVSGIWANNKWTQAPKSDYIILGLIAKLLRISPEPMAIIESISLANDEKKSYKDQIDWEPGFFIPPEELDEI